MNWAELCRIAHEVVERTRGRLPAELRDQAAAVPLTFEPFPSEAMLEDADVEPDILGLFIGSNLRDVSGAPEPLPAQILLFLENIWDEAEGNPSAYRDEVRITYLHELGHYLGWDEDDVRRRGLD